MSESTATWNGSSIMAGGSATYPDRDSFWARGRDYLQSIVRGTLWNSLNYSVGGVDTWYLLHSFATNTAQLPKTLFMDWANDGQSDFHQAVEEAQIRRLRDESPGTNQALIIFPHVVGGDLVDHPMFALWEALCLAYDIPVINLHEMMQVIVGGGGSLDDYYTSPDYTHPNDAGHVWIHSVVKDTLIALATGPVQWTGDIGDYARIYPDSEDFEYTPQTILGTGYDSKTGTWTETGTRIESNTAGSTVVYSGTFRSYGVKHYLNSNQTVEVDIDGGGFASVNVNAAAGVDVGTRAAHTVTIRIPVGGSIVVDEFWEI